MPQYFCGCWQYFIYYIYISNFGGNRIHLNQAILLKYKSNPLLPLPQESAQRFDPHRWALNSETIHFSGKGTIFILFYIEIFQQKNYVFRQLQVWVVQCTMMSVKIFYRLLCIHFEWLTCWNDSPSSSVVSKLGSSSWQFDKSLMANSLRPPAKFPPPPLRRWCWFSTESGAELIWNGDKFRVTRVFLEIVDFFSKYMKKIV